MSGNFDEKQEKELLQKLEELGLSAKESKVYLALLGQEQVGSSVLIRATALHGQFVYAALERLEELGLAKHAVHNGRKKFSANPPARLVALVEEKRLAAQVVAQELSKRFVGKEGQDFEVYQGASAFVAQQFALLDQLPDEAVMYVLGSGGDKYMALMADHIDEYERKRVAKGVQIRYISTGGSPLYLKVMAQTRRFFDYRVLPSPAPGVDTDILSDKIVFHLFGDPVVSFAFKNKEIANGYRCFFEVLWGLSSK